MITRLLGGLWHGAGWIFVVWGGPHGLMLVVNYLWRRVVPWRLETWWSRAFARLLTFLAVSLGWVFFRAANFRGALAAFVGMVTLPSSLATRFRPRAATRLAFEIGRAP